MHFSIFLYVRGKTFICEIRDLLIVKIRLQACFILKSSLIIFLFRTGAIFRTCGILVGIFLFRIGTIFRTRGVLFGKNSRLVFEKNYHIFGKEAECLKKLPYFYFWEKKPRFWKKGGFVGAKGVFFSIVIFLRKGFL